MCYILYALRRYVLYDIIECTNVGDYVDMWIYVMYDDVPRVSLPKCSLQLYYILSYTVFCRFM